MKTKNTPPAWASNAVATKHGWANPLTGELLVSIKGLENPLEGYIRNRAPKHIVLELESGEECKLPNALVSLELVDESVVIDSLDEILEAGIEQLEENHEKLNEDLLELAIENPVKEVVAKKPVIKTPVKKSATPAKKPAAKPPVKGKAAQTKNPTTAKKPATKTK